MVLHRFATHFNNAKNFGVNLYNQAQGVGSAIDRGARFAKQVYGVISSALRELGVDTGGVDRVADSLHGLRQLRDKVVHGNEVVGRAGSRLVGLM